MPTAGPEALGWGPTATMRLARRRATTSMGFALVPRTIAAGRLGCRLAGRRYSKPIATRRFVLRHFGGGYRRTVRESRGRASVAGSDRRVAAAMRIAPSSATAKGAPPAAPLAPAARPR